VSSAARSRDNFVSASSSSIQSEELMVHFVRVSEVSITQPILTMLPDVTLICQDERYDAHRAIVGSQSTYFNTILAEFEDGDNSASLRLSSLDNGDSTSLRPGEHIEIELPDDKTSVKAFLSYCYGCTPTF